MPDGTWGPPCGGSIKVLVRDDGLRLPIRDEIIPLVARLMDRTEALGYDIRPDWTWGNSCRKIAGTNTWSNHAWGLAVDINAPENPRGPRTGAIRDHPDVIAMWKAHGFRWGGDYPGTPDDMHFEFMGSTASVATYIRKFDEKYGQVVVEDKPVEKEEDEDMAKTFGVKDKGIHVTDGVFRKHIRTPAHVIALESKGIAQSVGEVGQDVLDTLIDIDEFITLMRQTLAAVKKIDTSQSAVDVSGSFTITGKGEIK